MKVFSPAHFLRHIAMPTLQQFAEAHVLGPDLSIDWSLPAHVLPAEVTEAVEALEASLADTNRSQQELARLAHSIHLWYDDLRRVHLMSNDLAVNEFLAIFEKDKDTESVDAFADRDLREKSLWMFTFRQQVFRDVELQLAFQAKVNGKYWKKHRIQPGLEITEDRGQLETFSNAVAKLYEKVGGGKSTHIELSKHASDDSLQVTLYVEGPITAVTHFTDNNFQRLTTRIALETALVYQKATGFIETIVKGGARNHTKVLQLFGEHVVGQQIDPEEIERSRYKLNVLRDGALETFDDLSHLGVKKIRLRRALLAPKGSTAISFHVEASPEVDQDDAIQIALDALKVQHSFEAEYHMNGATVIIYLLATSEQRERHFSFDLYSTGSSTIKNLSQQNEPVAIAVLKALNVIDDEETGE